MVVLEARSLRLFLVKCACVCQGLATVLAFDISQMPLPRPGAARERIGSILSR